MAAIHSQMLKRFGEVIDDKESILYWAAKNDIPIFCPPLTDGSIGDMLFFHSYKNPGLRWVSLGAVACRCCRIVYASYDMQCAWLLFIISGQWYSKTNAAHRTVLCACMQCSDLRPQFGCHE